MLTLFGAQNNTICRRTFIGCLNGGEGESFIAAAQLQPITAMDIDANVDLVKSDEFGSATTTMSNQTSGGNMAGRISSTSYSQ